MQIPKEFAHYKDDPAIPWAEFTRAVEKKIEMNNDEYIAFTDTAIDFATKECMKENQNKSVLSLGVEAALARGRLAEVLFLSSDIEDTHILALKAIALFVLSDIAGLRETKQIIEKIISEESPVDDQVRLSTVKILLAAAERDTSVIICVMEFDNLLETYPEQIENPLTETLFTLYVVGTILREVGEATKASRIADTLEDMAKKKGHRMMLALTENLRGNISHLVGNMRSAEEHYYRLKDQSRRLSFKLGVGMALNNLGSMMTYSLRLEDALECFEDALTYMNTDSARLVTLTNLGEIATLLGRYDEAEGYFKEALRLDLKTQRGLLQVYTLYCDLLSRLDRIDEAKEYLKQAEKLAKTTENPLEQCAYLHAKGIMDAAQGKYIEAIKIYEEELALAKKKNVFEMLIRSKLELARTYIHMYKKSHLSDLIDSAMYHLDDLAQIAKEQRMNSLRGRILLLKSDLLNLAGREFEARGYLERVLGIARFTEDNVMEAEATARLQRIETHEELPIDTSFGKSFDRVSAFKHPGSPRQVHQPIIYALIAIDRKSGLTEFVHYFDEPLDMDSSIIAGFIAAVGSFSGQMMGSSGKLRSITHEGFTLMMEHTKMRIIVLIATDESFELRYRLREFAALFDTKFPPVADLEMVEPRRYKEASKIVNQLFTDVIAA
ncbi:MAG: tetratricopeptide repeat protein [Candidatus Thorarchaeota archaeon]|nr:tetratricopeptide repeat protein [Candidatus Thorarchaeota archaeon]